MQDAPLGFVLTLTSAIAEATIDAMIDEPAEGDARSRVGFDAMWRVLAGRPGRRSGLCEPLPRQRAR